MRRSHLRSPRRNPLIYDFGSTGTGDVMPAKVSRCGSWVWPEIRDYGAGVGVTSGVAVGSGLGVGSDVGSGTDVGSGLGAGSGDGVGDGVGLGMGVGSTRCVGASVGLGTGSWSMGAGMGP